MPNIKAFTFTNKSDKSITLIGVTDKPLELAASGSATVNMPSLSQYWSEGLKAWGKFIEIKTSFVEMEKPTLGYTTSVNDHSFVNGINSQFELMVDAKDYVDYPVKFVATVTGVDTYKVEMYEPVKQVWYEISKYPQLEMLRDKKKRYIVRITVGKYDQNEELTATVKVAVNDQAGTELANVSSTVKSSFHDHEVPGDLTGDSDLES